MKTGLSLLAKQVMSCAVMAGSGTVLLSYHRNINYCCFATESVTFSCFFMINNKALFAFFLWLSKRFSPKQNCTCKKKPTTQTLILSDLL